VTIATVAAAAAALLAAPPALTGVRLAAGAAGVGVLLLGVALLTARPEPARWGLLGLLAAYGAPWGAPGVPWWAVGCAPLVLVVGELAFWSLDLAAVSYEAVELGRSRARRLVTVAAGALACGAVVAALSALGARAGAWLTVVGALAAAGVTVWLSRPNAGEAA
jgi:hypothetical protein